MKIINLTPHEIKIGGYATDGGAIQAPTFITVPASGMVARISSKREFQYSILNEDLEMIEVFKTIFGEIENLPKEEKNTIYVVSALVKSRCPERKDVFSPGTLIRNEKGEVIGCDGLTQ